MRARKITKNEINRFRMKHTFKLVETSAEDIPRPEAHRNDNASDGVLPEENAFPTSAQRETLDGPMKRKSVRPTEDPTLVQEARTRSASAAVTSPLQGTIAHADAVEDAQDLSVRRRRGRPPKRSLEKTRSPPVQDAQSTEASTAEPPPALAATETDVVEVQDLPLRRGRGRPPKRVAKKKPSSAATDTQNPGKAKSSSTRAMRSNKRAPEDESLRKTKPGEPAEQENGEVEPMESEEQEQDKESVVGAQKPIILQPFEVQFPESGDDDSGQAADGQTDRPAKTSGDEGVDARADAEQEEGQEEETVKTTRKKQRRRAKEEALQQDLTLEGEQDQTRFYSQYGKLQAALAGVYHVGLARVNQKEYRHRIKITAPVIRELADACKEMNDHIDILQDAGRPDEQTGELEPELKQRLLDLFNHAGVVLDDAADNDADLIEQVYAHAIPELTRVLKSLLVYFESCDSFSVSTKLSRLHLRTAMKLIRTITDLEEQVRTFKERHKIELEPKNLIRPVHNEIYLNLKDVHSAFAQLVSAEQKKRPARRQQLVAPRYSVSRTKKRKENASNAEPDATHLNTIPLDHPERQGTLELDANGQPFERVEVFAQRNSLAPGFRPKHEAEEWPLEHSRALGEGLARFAGPMVYEQIFREYCHRDGILRPYNVSQIVAKALDIREAMIRLNEEEGKETEQWVLNIPDPTVYLPQG
ncbi:hypothetical protein H2203_003475 [Taxawa tesnikishii (nom. ined.)]|nr:hypothetical protein H2203_003475 [Dothideales sp. JES 119]